jgi:hypothetical protein
MAAIDSSGYAIADPRDFNEIRRLKDRNEKLEKLLAASKALDKAFINVLSNCGELLVWRTVLAELDQP